MSAGAMTQGGAVKSVRRSHEVEFRRADSTLRVVEATDGPDGREARALTSGVRSDGSEPDVDNEAVAGSSDVLSGRASKRLFDLCVSVPLALATVPLVLVLAATCAAVFRANPFFRQVRVGQDGRRFVCTKLRTLPVTAPTDADRASIESHNECWVGRFLRRSHLDELPQLWLVVLGTMSMVGPRPVIPAHSNSFDPVFVEQRLWMKPGLSGLWQISPHAHLPVGEHPEYDLYYLQHQNFRLDVWLIAATVRTMLRPRSTRRLEQVPGWTGAVSGSPEAAPATFRPSN